MSKGLIITLTPKDESGIERNKKFADSNTVKLALGSTHLEDDGTLRCVWKFEGIVPDRVIKGIAGRFTKNLDQAKEKADNFTYEVEFIK